jgi:hypothetical protein
MEEHCFIISYDLCQPGQDYDALYKALKSFPTWGKLTESTWAVTSNQNVIEIRDYLNQFIDKNDRLIIILSGRTAAWTNVIAPNDWIKNNIIK